MTDLSDSNKRIVEVNGVRMEIDLRHARTVDTYRVGDKVKVLVKDYGNSYASHPGVIVGFDQFKNLPTIVVAYVAGWNAEVKFAHLNEQSKDVEIAPMVEDEVLPTRTTILQQFDREIGKKQLELEDLRQKRRYFLQRFGQAFERYRAEAQQEVSE